MTWLFAEVMDKMPSLSTVWLGAFCAGIVAFALARYVRFGWLVGLLVVLASAYFNAFWSDRAVAAHALQESPVVTRLAQASLALPVVCLALGVWSRTRRSRGREGDSLAERESRNRA